MILKILCINPNSSREVTDGIRKTCEKYVLTDTRIKVEQIDEASSGIEKLFKCSYF